VPSGGSRQLLVSSVVTFVIKMAGCGFKMLIRCSRFRVAVYDAKPRARVYPSNLGFVILQLCLVTCIFRWSDSIVVASDS
jgi:hypothetical protein